MLMLVLVLMHREQGWSPLALMLLLVLALV